MATKITDEELLESVEAYHVAGDNQSRAAEYLGLASNTVSDRLREARIRGLMIDKRGTPEGLVAIERALPKRGVKRYLLTSAQTHTKLYTPFWKNLMALKEHYNAELLVSTFNYYKDARGQNRQAKRRNLEAEVPESMVPAELVPYLCNDRVDLAPKLSFCGELQILPTARRPLSGFESYTYRKSTIVPHTTIALNTVGAAQGEGVKLLMTTGTVTQRNYIQRREGFRGEHFHAYGALLVEVDTDGSWWPRHVLQGDDGSLCDLNLTFRNGRLTNSHSRVADIMWGDVHGVKVDPIVANASWVMPGNLLDTLRPYTTHVHDLLNFGPSHHVRKDPFEVFRNYVHANRSSLATELLGTAQVLLAMTRKWMQTVVVNSNHDRHQERFLKEVDWRDDMENAEYILKWTARCLEAIRKGDKEFNLLRETITDTWAGSKLSAGNIRFLGEDESDFILKGALDGGIQAGVHGDRGVDGAQGTPAGFAKAARKMNIADKHKVYIIDHAYGGGVCQLNLGYNKGMSSWVVGHIVTYLNGQRTIALVWKGKCHAAQPV